MSRQFKIKIGDKELKIDIKNLTEQANGSCFVQYGNTLILTTAVASDKDKEGIDFFPLNVEYQERYYAAGKILGSRYIRRESRPSEKAILVSRLIDRAIRPLFPKKLRREVQVIPTCLSWDGENDPDILGLLGASVSLAISNIPWNGPIAGVRVGRIDNKFIVNPTYEEREKSDMDLVVSGIKKNNEILVNMLEAEGKELEEKIVLEAIEWAKPYIEKIIDFEFQIIKDVGKEKIKIQEKPVSKEIKKDVESFLGNKLASIICQKNKKINKFKEELVEFIKERCQDPNAVEWARDFFEEQVEKIIHKNILLSEKRPDGRKIDQIRDISCEVGLLPKTHGSGLFCRGQTKTISILTLGAPGDVKLLEGMEVIAKKRFMHHYNFPPYSTGEVKPLKGPSRRDIGHGMLVEKALTHLIPDFDIFPYTIRIVSEILSSNGSTSMASVSSSSLALMDAGVPIKRPAAGIALGLMTDNNGKYKIITDIQGPEDHYGDMDFKVAGTRKGITAIQMDVKIKGISKEILREALSRARKARLQILEKMEQTISQPRPRVSPFAPKIIIIKINPEKIRDVIGHGGKVINEIIEECGVSIDIEEDGKIFVTAEKEEAAKKAVSWIKNITREIKVGEVFQGKVKRILDFGAFVEILPGQEGLIHISQLANHRVKRVEDVVRVGDIVPVKVISVDEHGRINLSLKALKKHSK